MDLAEKSKRKPSEEPSESSSEPAAKRPKPSDQENGTSASQEPKVGNGTRDQEPMGNKPVLGGDEEHRDEVVSQFVELPPIPDKPDPLPPLASGEKKELERYLDMTKDDTWREDWMGNLNFADVDILNPDGKSRERAKRSLYNWADRGKLSRKLLANLVRHVYNSSDIPSSAKRILASMEQDKVLSIQSAIRRTSYDPEVLRDDGWTTAKSDTPVGASGGPFRIGEKIFWNGHEGVVIAYVHDQDIGDLWKAMWVEGEFDTFDLEAEELDDGKRRFERKLKQKEQQLERIKAGSKTTRDQTTAAKSDNPTDRRSGRKASADFNVPDIEHGIIMAVSYGRGARPGVFWPARVVHFSEMQKYGPQKRASNKHKIDVVFLAPYWNSSSAVGSGRRMESYTDSLQKHGSSIFSSGPLFELETIDVSHESVQQYPYDPSNGLDIDQLVTSFRFAGLPKAAFARFVESHRLAMALKTYSKDVLQSTAATEIDKTTAGLFEAHPLAGQTACFPDAVLHLPFEFILGQLPAPHGDDSDKAFSESNVEPALQLGAILEAMKPPACWGENNNAAHHVDSSTPEAPLRAKHFNSPPLSLDFGTTTTTEAIPMERFLVGLHALSRVLGNINEPMSILLTQNLGQLVKQIPINTDELQSMHADAKCARLKSLVKLWIVVKTHGEELISSYTAGDLVACLSDWRRACERIYKHITIAFSHEGSGNGISWVVTDSVCNLHLTSNECFERAVRLPAALKVAKEVVQTKKDRLKIMNFVRQEYLAMAEKKVMRRAHNKSYLKRLKKKCQSVEKEGTVIALTEDSDGKGGEDTMGTRGSWNAAVAAVAASLQAVDMIINGDGVNVFCLTRPPGHHAGRELHAMKAVSNGFCLLNNAACAALYATAPVSEGGPGLRRVCVIDIDVHHGNGTQDILCSTYDPRFLYVSIHAGGPDVNGVDPSTDEAEGFTHHLARNPKRGIFPGRCGDFSPHDGVLNIPLGTKVTSHALGAALLTKVTPAVEKFSPELIIISTGFDAHKNDPLGLGGLSAEDFGTLTEVICKLAHKSCSGRVLSVLEGGYGVPCCRLPQNLFNPDMAVAAAAKNAEVVDVSTDMVTKAPVAMTSDVPIETKPEILDAIAPSNPESSKIPASDGKVNGEPTQEAVPTETSKSSADPTPKPLPIMDLGDELPETMMDNMPYALMKRLDKCHAEGFMDCVREHVSTLAKCNMRV